MSRPPSTTQGQDGKIPPTTPMSSDGKTVGHDSWFSDDSGTPMYPQTIPDDATNASTKFGDTIHHLSPASPISIRTEYEGDMYDYTSPAFMKILQDIGPREGDEVSFATSYVSCVEPELQRTIAIVRPEAMPYEDVIMRAVNEAGFSIIQSRHIHMTPEQVSELYALHYGKPEFPHLVISMSVGPMLVLSIADLNAINKWKNMIGENNTVQASWFFPLSMRKRFGLKEAIPGALHASENYTEALKENRYFVPDNIIEPLIQTESGVWDYCGLYINNTLMDGLVELVRVKPIEPVLYLAEWLLTHNPFQPRYPDAVAVLPT